jgi:hypothetical protein
MAFNIIKKTLYSLLQLLVKIKKLDLLFTTLQSLQVSFANCWFLIINKKSIINLKTLFLINNQL